ncbi:hypothetical protein BCR37DRAFT_379804 [Protomyces lactucae-debilis]|uniref:Uncharacterized protein n=1 Tax=Protomyces lactucae-debilis TaxID=2754530 RepID=A0A1Y2FDA9_PROLT|nr:uncharacterized protein BCR37DRAFT_379804 [Protomyces lactucae-debilis]ORY81908.1 hypothetical protein BCR37DRAFT_379804 [Protomyces lactucae-debilis]
MPKCRRRLAQKPLPRSAACCRALQDMPFMIESVLTVISPTLLLSILQHIIHRPRV